MTLKRLFEFAFLFVMAIDFLAHCGALAVKRDGISLFLCIHDTSHVVDIQGGEGNRSTATHQERNDAGASTGEHLARLVNGTG